MAQASPSATDLAYVMYTSGSTGRPKGVGISHLAATQSLLAHNDLIPHFNRFLQFASPTFDVSVFEVFFPFFRGATLIGSDREQMLLDISHVMTEMRVDAAELTPTVAGELLRTRAAAPCLKVLLTIGEMLTKHVVEEFGQSENSEGILHGMYGPTEAAIHCTAATHFQADSAVNLIGKPFSTVSAFIMSLESEDKSQTNAELRPLPIGQIGELVVGGSQLADGYINRPEENAKAFIESPVYGRLYRTGDKGRMSSTGEIECFGRISSGQVKLRGQRIELGEIENVICKTSNVRATVAIVSGGSLAAFVLANDQGTTDRELRDTCRQWLPRFMVPGEFILIDQFPQLPSGKIDRKGLEADFVRRRNAAQSVDQLTFRDEVEETIASCVFDVLGKNVPINDSLVSAGLDSLAAIRLASHLLDMGMRLDVARLLEADSVDGIWHLAKAQATSESTEDTQTAIDRIRQLVRDAGAARIEALGLSAQTAEIEPCSHIQQAMILETARDTKAYSNWIELQFEPTVTSDSVHAAFASLFEQNALLRSGFVEIGLKENSYARFTWNTHGDQIIHKCDAFDYEICLISENDLLHPLRLQLKDSSDGVRVLVHIHHALYDGWSWQLILRDLQHILSGEELLLPKPTYSIITDFFIEYKLSESANDSSNFWRDQLQGSPSLAFPNFHSVINVSPKTQEASRVLDISVSNLNEVSHSLQVSRQTIFQAAYCYMLSTYLGSKDVTFGTVFSGRTLPVKGIETVLGPCIRTLPTRMDLDKMQNVTDLMLAIQNMNRKSLEHGSLPLQDIKKASGIDPQRSLFDTALVWQESIWSEDQSALFHEIGNGEFLEFAFLLDLEPKEDRIHAKMSFQQSILPHEQAQILLEQIDVVASILIENPALPIEDVASHLPSSILSISNAEPETEAEVDIPSLVSEIERIASTDPYRKAVEVLLQGSSDSESMIIESISYAQLHSRSNRLANYLTQAGLQKGDLTALVLEKSIDILISVLALAKIGAGLLSLAHDTDATPQLTNSILATAKPRFCLVNQSVIDLTLPASTSQVLIPDSLNDFDDCLAFPTNDDGFHIICAENSNPSHSTSSPTNNDLMNTDFNIFSFSSYNLQSHIKALADSYPAVSSGSKLLHTSPLASASEY
jgi:non-ribosomal peptide synthetase component F/aryl carrier-like protein